MPERCGSNCVSPSDAPACSRNPCSGASSSDPRCLPASRNASRGTCHPAPAFTPGPARLIANYIFGGSGGSRLFKRIRDKEGLSYGISSSFAPPQKDDGATFTVFAISAPQNAPKVEASFQDELARTLKDGFTADEVAAAKKSWLEEQMVARSQEGVLLTNLTVDERFDRTMKWQEVLETRVAALSPEQVSAAFRRYIQPSALSIVKAGDFKKAAAFQ